jgi:phospholipid/cholesterol/gamma-HCH transport system ATP-binding protein
MNKGPTVQLIDVHKTFGTQHVLKGVNLSIYEGKTIVIVGESGQGKSSIIKHILGLIKPDSGKVLVYGKDVNRISKKELKDVRSNFGVLFQNAALFDSMTVFDNVALPLRERTSKSEQEISAIVNEKLEMMDLHESNEKFPAQLSGGMRKRVGLARALALNPKIVFFDEPTTGLDVAKSSERYRRSVSIATGQSLKCTSIPPLKYRKTPSPVSGPRGSSAISILKYPRAARMNL